MEYILLLFCIVPWSIAYNGNHKYKYVVLGLLMPVVYFIFAGNFIMAAMFWLGALIYSFNTNNDEKFVKDRF